MAAGDDDGEDNFVFPFRQQEGDTTSQKESSQWSESCYGIWLKDKTRDERNKEPVCLGINIIHITKVRRAYICIIKFVIIRVWFISDFFQLAPILGASIRTSFESMANVSLGCPWCLCILLCLYVFWCAPALPHRNTWYGYISGGKRKGDPSAN